MAFEKLLVLLGIVMSMPPVSNSPFSFLAVLALNVYICHLKRVLYLQSTRSRHKVTPSVQSMQTLNSHLSEIITQIFEVTSDLFCVYQGSEVQSASKTFAKSLADVQSFWTRHLTERSRLEFEEGIKRTMTGDSVQLSVTLRRADSERPSTILSLSPILDALFGTRAEVSLNLSMRQVHWNDSPAVLIHADPHQSEPPVQSFLKTVNHEFRTPLNIMIGLSDLILCDKEITQQSVQQRLKLLRQCACTLLATINSIIHQCELEWKLPTGLQHIGFNPISEIKLAVQLIRSKLSRRGNAFDFILDNTLPTMIWGNVAQFRHVFAFLIQTCSELTKNDQIFMSIKSNCHSEKCELQGELTATCPAVCSASEFNSVLQLFCAPFEPESSLDSPQSSSLLRQADRQSLLRLSVAREMCRLFLGDLFVSDIGNLSLHFSMVFSNREHFVLKRKGNLFADEEEFVLVRSKSYAQGSTSEELLVDFTPTDTGSAVMKNRSQTEITRTSLAFLDKRRRIKTVPGMTTSQPPCSSGDRDDTDESPHESRMLEAFALIAEDVPSNALVLSGMLKRLGVRSVTVSDGAEVLTFLQEFLPDLIFMDCEMPVLDGLEATRQVRRMNIKVPIIAVTANGPEKEPECLEAGMDFFLSKPVRIDRLATLLRQLNLRCSFRDLMNSDYSAIGRKRRSSSLMFSEAKVQVVRALPNVEVSSWELAKYLGNKAPPHAAKPAEKVNEPQVRGLVLYFAKTKKPLHLHSQSSMKSIFPSDVAQCPSARINRVTKIQRSKPLTFKKSLQDSDSFQREMRRHLHLSAKCSLKLLSRAGRTHSPALPWWEASVFSQAKASYSEEHEKPSANNSPSPQRRAKSTLS